MLGDPISAHQALEYGLVNQVVAETALHETSLDWCNKISANAPLAIAEMKRLFRHGLTQDFESHSHHVLMSVLNLFKSNDFNEAVSAYIEKREPKFKGN